MPHPPFEDWLFTEEVLSLEQEEVLRDHLRECPACRQLATRRAESEAALREMAMAQPRRNFLERWTQIRQHREEAGRRLWHAWLVLALCGAGALILAAILGLQLVALVLSPIHLAAELARSATSLASQVTVAEVLWSVLLQSARQLVPMPVWAGLVVSLGLLCALWVLVILRFDVQGVGK